ncbi:MAG: glycosyltransferase [Proteobacteria bacterium]|nr:glycosyltransferase [Pseudomonadota bacterium]
MRDRCFTEALYPRLNLASKEDQIATVPAGTAVPRILHQTYPTKELPAPLRGAVERTRAASPNWDHRLYDDNDIVNYIRKEYGETILAAYLRIDPMYGAARADLFRYLLMYRTGGVYLDIKSVATRALDDVIRPEDTYILSQWHGKRFAGMGMGVHRALRGIVGTEYQQWHIVAAPGHPFLERVIENVLRNLRIYNPGIHGAGKRGVLSVTGPIAYTLAIHPLLRLHSHRFADSAEELGFDYNVFMTGRNSSAHHFLFRSHYAVLQRPIVAVGPVSRVYGFPFRAGRKLLRMARLVD